MLLYTLLIMSVTLVLVGIVADSSIHEFRFSGDELRSLSAFYASDTGIECIRYWQMTSNAFDPRKPVANYECGFGETISAGASSGDTNCAESGTVTYSYMGVNAIGGFNGGTSAPCTEVTVTVSPAAAGACTISIRSAGKNDCSGAANAVQRSRWEVLTN